MRPIHESVSHGPPRVRYNVGDFGYYGGYFPMAMLTIHVAADCGCLLHGWTCVAHLKKPDQLTHTRGPGALLRNQKGVLDHVQNLQIHAVRAKIHTCVSVAELEWKFPL